MAVIGHGDDEAMAVSRGSFDSPIADVSGSQSIIKQGVCAS